MRVTRSCFLPVWLTLLTSSFHLALANSHTRNIQRRADVSGESKKGKSKKCKDKKDKKDKKCKDSDWIDRGDTVVMVCDEADTFFDHRVLVDFVGMPELVNEMEIAALEEQFKLSYNGLTQEVCMDGSFRAIDSVVIEQDAVNSFGTRRLQSNVTILNPSNESSISQAFTFRYRVQGSCRGCKDNAELFDEGVTRRKRSRALQTQKKGSKGQKGSTSQRQLHAHPDKKDKTFDTKGKVAECEECIAPSASLFTFAYNGDVQTLRANGTITNIEGVTDVSQLEEVACAADTTVLTSDVIVDFFGDPTLATEDQLAALEQGFVDTYNALNALNSETCDTLFREVTSAQIVVDGGFSRQLEVKELPSRSLLNRAVGTTFSFRFRVTGSCRGCASNTTYFNEGVRRALLPTAPFDAVGRHLQQSGVCFCPSSAPDYRAPTEVEFLEGFSDTVEVLKAEGIIDTELISSVDQVSEVDAVQCSAEINYFESDVFLDFLGNPLAVTQQETTALETGFQTTYNDLAQTFCDPYFRTVENVTIDELSVSGIGRSLQQRATTTVSFRFRVSGRCRGCSSGSTLFNVGYRRALMVGTHGRRFQESSECFCDPNYVDRRPPTKDEFLVEYNATVIELNLTNVDSVVAISEPVPSPTLSPSVDNGSAAPFTDQPSVAPVTSQPSAAPFTLPPSLAPVTGQPSAAPFTLPPSLAPVTGQPSAAPFTLPPSLAPVTGQPSPAPFTAQPSPAPVTGQPSPAPLTLPPSLAPVTGQPSPAPFTAQPSPAPFTAQPSPAPFTAQPSAAPLFTPAPSTMTPTALASVAPSVSDSTLFSKLFDVPFNLFETCFGQTAPATFPLYAVTNWTNSSGTFAAVSLTGSSVTMVVDEVVMTVLSLQASQANVSTDLQNFVATNRVAATAVRGTMFGPSGSENFVGLILSYLDDRGSAVNVAIPFGDPDDFGYGPQLIILPSRRTLETPYFEWPETADDIGQQAEQPLRWLKDLNRADEFNPEGCGDVIAGAFNSTTCGTAGDVVVVDDTCVNTVKNTLKATVDEAVRTRDETISMLIKQALSTLLKQRSDRMTFGYLECAILNGDSVDNLPACVLDTHRDAVVREISARVELDASIATQEALLYSDYDATVADACSSSASAVDVCFSCEQCSVQLPTVECCVDADCNVNTNGNVCVSNTCIDDGTPRFTLRWGGDDDLDLHVITPGGVEIYFQRPYDNTTGAELNRDDVPYVVGANVENIYFPLDQPAPLGTYTFFVDENFRDGGTSDPWTVSVVVNGEEVVSRSSTGSSDRFIYVLEAQPTEPPAASPSSLPTIRPSTAMPTATTSVGPTLPPTLSLFDLLSSVSFDGGAALSTAGTPQQNAFSWLSGTSNLNLLTDARKIQRYALATISYASSIALGTLFPAVSTDGEECSSSLTFCDQGEVIRLQAKGINISGSLPPEIGLLRSLQNVSLSENYFTGTIPTEIGALSNLVNLDLYSNSLQGTVPTEIGSFINLRILFLDRNKLEGLIPTSFGLLTNLLEVEMDYNRFNGTIPTELGLLSSLRVLDLNDNALSGPIPSEFFSLINLQRLKLEMNSLTGTISPAVGQLTSLGMIKLSSNSIGGSLPTTLGQLTWLEELELNGMALTGTIPTEFGMMTQIRDIDLFENLLVGPIPSEIGLLSNLEEMEFYSNRLSGPIPTELGRLKKLAYLKLYENNLIGTVPTEFGNLVSLVEMHLRRNNLNGVIPTQLAQLSILRTLDLMDNGLTGNIPTELGALVDVVEIDLSSLSLVGSIPSQLGNLYSLVYLSLFSNNLTGAVPTELGMLSQLRRLQLEDNLLTGTVPPEVCNVGITYFTTDCNTEIICSCCTICSSSPTQ